MLKVSSWVFENTRVCALQVKSVAIRMRLKSSWRAAGPKPGDFMHPVPEKV